MRLGFAAQPSAADMKLTRLQPVAFVPVDLLSCRLSSVAGCTPWWLIAEQTLAAAAAGGVQYLL
jgi:hypothetical protein